jgi:hypothetical protein
MPVRFELGQLKDLAQVCKAGGHCPQRQQRKTRAPCLTRFPCPPTVARVNAQGEVRHELSKRTHQISVFTEGILAMQRTLLGVIQVRGGG